MLDTQAERRLVSVLFSDVSGFTAMSERLEPDDVHTVMTRVFERLTAVVVGHGGRVDKLMGDAVLAVFGHPVAHEDDADRAVKAALEMHSVMADLNADIGELAGCTLELHSGINSGIAVVGGAALDGTPTGPLGDAVNLASRLQSLAGRDELLISAETRALLRGDYELEDAGAYEVKGKRVPVQVTRVVAVAPARSVPSRRRATFVGRESELAALKAQLDGVRAGRPAIVSLVGDAGSGKTRLVEQFHAETDAHWVEGRAYPDSATTPYALLVDLVRRVAGISESDAALDASEKVQHAVAALVSEDSLAAPLLALLDLHSKERVEPEWFEQRLIEALASLVSHLASREPAVVCLQDVHWADPASMRVVTAIIGSSEAPLLLLTNARPERAHGLPNELVVPVPPLAQTNLPQLVSSMLDGAVVPPELIAWLQTRTDGNPFFIEESINSLLESGAVVVRDGTCVLTKPIEHVALPPSIHGLIASRIDRLDPERRRLLREAAVVGREFLYEVLRQVDTAVSRLDLALADLQDAQFIRETHRQADLEYIFKHALTQEVAYDGLLKKERQELHSRAARAIELVLRDRVIEYAETLAHHYTNAGDARRAAFYLALSGQKALQRFALAEAQHCYAQAVGLLHDDREREDDLARAILGWCEALYFDGNLNQIAALLQEYRDVFARVGDPELVGLYHAKAAMASWAVIDYQTAVTHGERALAIAADHDLPRVRTHVLPWLQFCYLALGRADELSGIEEVPLLESEKDPLVREAAIVAAAGRCLTAASMGDLTAAQSMADGLIEHGRRTEQSRAMVLGLVGRAQWASMRLDAAAAIDACQQARRLVRDPMLNAWVLGWIMAFQAQAGRFDDMAVTVRELEAHHAARPLEWCESTMRASAGGAAMVSGQLSNGMAVLQREIALHVSRDDHWVTGYLRIVLGEIYVRILRREVPVSLRSLVCNPGFVLRHALPAARHAQRELEHARNDFHAIGEFGFDGRVAFALARLYDAQHDREAAEREARACVAFLQQCGVEAAADVSSFLAATAGSDVS